ncbi:STAS domain-containing protein (plasmid) [Streptomycetaceae bacterium NBC_01309]
MTGELDLATAPELRAALTRAAADHTHITVDLAALRFCDCTGLNALLAGARAAHAHGTTLRLRSVPVSLARLLRLSHTTGAFTLD